MAIIVSEKRFSPAPEGMHDAVCVDVIDLGMVQSAFGASHKIRVVWELAEVRDDGQPFTIRKMYTASLNSKSNLYKDLKTWRGRDLSPAERSGFDLEDLIGKPCQILVVHSEGKDGRTWANVQAVSKAGKEKYTASGYYVREQDREAEAGEERVPF